MKKNLFLMIALLCAVVQGAWADVSTLYADGVFTGFTATAGAGSAGPGNGGYTKLVDGSTDTKWCTNSSPFYIEFHSSAPFVPTGYIMTTGGDTQSYSGRNPKSWTIKAKAHAEDDWTTLVTVENDATMPAKNYEPVSFAISGNTTAYQYFRLDVSATRGDSWFQLSEFQFTGTTNNISFANVTCVESTYTVSPTPSIEPTVTLGNTTLTLGTDYTATLNGVDVTSLPISISEAGDYTLTLTGTSSYAGTRTINFRVVSILSGSGTEGDPYTIGSTVDWNSFATYVNEGNNYIGKYVQLTANVEVSEMVGLRDGNPFCGTFLGNGHTITANISSTATGTGVNEQGVAPFHYINGATIKNLTVAGTIASASCHTSGLVGFASGINLIEDCTVTATINQNNNYAGGIIGHGQNSNTTIRGCAFAGTINGVGGDRSNIGGLWGWSNSATPTLVNCLEAGTYTNIASMHPMGLQSASGTITNCYYVTPQIGSPKNACTVSGAKQAYATVPEGEISMKMQMADGNNYYLLCTVSGVSENYYCIGSEISVVPTVTYSGTTLTEGTDYTYAISPAPVLAVGNYTLTITAQGTTYYGTKAINFTVNDHTAERLFSGFTATSGTGGTGDGGYAKLVDGRTDTKLCCNHDNPTFVEFYSSGLFVPTGYIMTTAADAASYTGRNPKSWTIKAKVNENDEWTTLVTETDNTTVGASNTTPYEFTISGNTTAYKYFRFEVSATQGADLFQLAELQFKGTTTDIAFASVTGVESTYTVSPTPSITPTVTFDNLPLSLGTHYTATLNGNAVTSLPISISEVDDYTLTLTGKGSITGTKSINFRVIGPGDAEDYPITIGSASEWNTFASNVTGGKSYSGKFLKLTADISISTKASGNFSGTFDGNGKTITANISGTGSMALFGTLNGGTIKNLTLAGSISGGQHTAALLVSLGNGGTNIIENCVVTADVTCSSTHMGGFLADGNSSNITIRGCVFKGKMTGGGTAKGVFYGWGDNGGTGSVTDCLYIMASGQDTDGLDLTKGSSTVTVTKCYKTASAGSQGTQAYASSNAPATLGSLVQDYGVVKAYQNSLLYDGKYYVAQTTVLNITSPSVGQVIGSDGKNYNYANLPSGVTPVAKICYLFENYGLALAMSDESGQMQQAQAITTCAAHKAPFAGGIWRLPSKDEWEAMGVIENGTSYGNLRDGFSGVGGTNMHADKYWSSTDGNFFSLGMGCWWDNRPNIYDDKGNFYVRAGLEFSLLPIEEIEIGSTNDWNTFASNVNGGDSYINKHVKLTADIDISTPVGVNDSHPFRGTFDGQGHTITATLTDDGNSGLAPFRCIGGATIKNLTVAGTIASSQQHSAGLVGYASGNNLIENCVVTATLNISSNYAGGIIGHGLNSITTIRGCVFAGTINGVGGNRGNVGGIWGWSDNATPTLVNCLEAGTYTNIASMHPMGLQSTSGTITDSYYLNAQMGEPSNACTVRGAKRAEAHATAPDDLGDMLVDYGMVQAYANGILFGGTYYVVYDLSGTGTENDPYIIANTDDWNTFASNVSGGDDYSGQFVKLTADISVSSMAGASDADSFQGTFMGDGVHTLTFTKGTAQSAFGEECCAPFRYVKNATIKNLCVEGDIYTSRMYAAGLVSRPSGTLTITDCHVSTVIHSSVSGDGTHGGIVARLGNATSTTISGCLFDGRLLTTNGTTSCGGIVGWHDSKTFSITNTLYAPNASITAASGETPINDGATIIRGGSLAEGATCYYTETLGTAQGTQVCTAAPEGEIIKVISVCNTTYYSLACTVSGVSASYNISEAASITPAVTLAGTTLTFATDYTATLDGVAVNELPVSIGTVGEHTLILTGTGNYTGAKTIEIVTLPDGNSDFTMTDGDTYTIQQDCDVASATYRKTTDRVGKFHSWLVPFDSTITAADLEKFTFYKINMIANSPDPSLEASDDIWVFVKRMSKNDVLRANMPYVYKPREAVTDYAFTTTTAVLKAKNTNVIAKTETMEDIYNFYATYGNTSATAQDPFYYVNIYGELSYGDAVTVGAFRWIIRVESKYGSEPSYARTLKFFDGEEEETTGIISIENGKLRIDNSSDAWYTIDGVKLDGKPHAKGVYIQNGRKVIIK